MAEGTPSLETRPEPSKLGPEIRLTFIGSTQVQNRYRQLLTPELQSRFPGTNPRSLSFQEYLYNSGIEKDEAKKLWDKATENISTFEVYKSPRPTKGTLITFMGYEVQYSPIVGKKTAGDRIRLWTEEGYNVIGVKYPEVFDSQVFKEQLLELASKAEDLGLGEDLTVSGLSFGSFAILKAMSLMSEKELTDFFSHIKKIRLHSPPSGKDDLPPALKKLAELTGQKGFKVHASYLKKPSLVVNSVLEQKGGQNGEIFEVVARGPLSEKQSGATKGIMYHYRDKAQALRLNEIFTSPRLLQLPDFALRLKNTSVKPDITLSTSTKDFMVNCENVLSLAKIFQDLGFETKVLFIEPLTTKDTISKISDILSKHGLPPQKTLIAFINEPWDGHNPLVLDNLMPALEDLEEKVPAKINEPAQIQI